MGFYFAWQESAMGDRLKKIRGSAKVLADQKAIHEKESHAHKRLREALTGDVHPHLPGFREVTQTGVIYVMARARELGFSYENPEWANFGQGAPETGDLPGQPERHFEAHFNPFNNEYGPVAGITALRQKVADLYNIRYREGKESKYTVDNVCICPGGRAALSRVAACMADVNVGYFLPDYTAYEQILSVFKNFVPIPFALDAESGYHLSPTAIEKEISSRGIQVVLTSNPGNPTGALMENDGLKELVQTARKCHCTFIMDEFYSHYIYTHDDDQLGRTVSSAEYVDDVNEDPILIVDGFTKNWRLPGWRVCWAVGPTDVIEAMQSAGSFIDGGANHVLQDTLARSNLLDPEFVKRDAAALQKHFKHKRDVVVAKLKEIGFKIDSDPDGTFYVWTNLKNFPAPLNNGMQFFETALQYKVICVPGIFFDVNPGHRRELFNSPYHHYVRFSCGPPLHILERGLAHLEKFITEAKAAAQAAE